MLTDDATLAMPPLPDWYRGRDAVAAFLGSYAAARAGPLARRSRSTANGQPAFADYLRDDDTGGFSAHGIERPHASTAGGSPI